MASLRAKLAELTVPELQKELKERGLKRSGVKAKLIERLSEAIEAAGGSQPTNPDSGSYTAIPSEKQGIVYQQNPTQGMVSMPQLQPTTATIDNQQDAIQMYMSQQQQQQQQQQIQAQQMASTEAQVLYNQQFMAQQLQAQGHQMQLPPMTQLLANQLQHGQDQVMLQQQQQQQQQQHRDLGNHQQPTQFNVQEIPLTQQPHSMQQHVELAQQPAQYSIQNVAQQKPNVTQPHEVLVHQPTHFNIQDILLPQERQPQHHAGLDQQATNQQQIQFNIQDIPLPQEIDSQVLQPQGDTVAQLQFNIQDIPLPQHKEPLISQEENVDQQVKEAQPIQKVEADSIVEQTEQQLIIPTDQSQQLKKDNNVKSVESEGEQQHNQVVSVNDSQPESVDDLNKKEEVTLATVDETTLSKETTNDEAEANVEKQEDNVDKDNKSDTPQKADESQNEIVDDGMAVDVQPSEEEKKLTEDVVEQSPPPVVKRQRKIKTSTPVQIKKRRVGEGKEETDKPAQRKRRWGSSTGNTSISINTDSLKDLIPAAVIEQDAIKEEKKEMEIEAIEEKEEGECVDTVDEITKEEEASVDVETKINEFNEPDIIENEALDKTETAGNSTEQHEGELLKPKPEVDPIVINRRVHVESTPVFADEGLGGNRFRESKEAVNPQCNVIHLENLVRPFTIRQLKELLEQNGKLIENGFWINKIKSFCFAQYSSEEEAVASREALDGIKWPSGTPKVLKADFAILDKLHDMTDGLLGDKVEEKHDQETKEEQPQIQLEERQIEKPKVAKLSRSKDREDSPAKLLDDLFNKTKTKPCIYWLPLTNQQVKDKDSSRDERREQRLTDRRGSVNENQPPFRDQPPQRNRYDNERRRSPPQQRFQARSYRQRSVSPAGRRNSFRRN